MRGPGVCRRSSCPAMADPCTHRRHRRAAVLQPCRDSLPAALWATAGVRPFDLHWSHASAGYAATAPTAYSLRSSPCVQESDRARIAKVRYHSHTALCRRLSDLSSVVPLWASALSLRPAGLATSARKCGISRDAPARSWWGA